MDTPTLPVTSENADAVYEWMFAPWVRAQGLAIVDVEEGRVVLRLPQDPEQQFFSGAMCGQSLMSAIDTAMALAVSTFPDRAPRGTAGQATRFLRPAMDEPLLVEATVLHAGRTAWYGEVHVRGEASTRLVAHATCEFH